MLTVIVKCEIFIDQNIEDESETESEKRVMEDNEEETLAVR